MAKNSSGVTAICVCGAVECDGEWTRSQGVVIAAKAAGLLPLGKCCECGKRGTLFGGFSDHSNINCCLN